MRPFTRPANNTDASSSEPVSTGTDTAGIKDTKDKNVSASDTLAITSNIPSPVTKTSWRDWYAALRSVLPVYISIHLAFFVITCLSVLFILRDFSWQAKPLYTLWQSWHHWDTGHYMEIATYGYTRIDEFAFFPLYPLLERVLTFFTHNPLLSGLIISNLAGLGMLIVLYRLVEEDFGAERAARSILYLSVFPTAFFLAAGYNESLFIFLTLLSFYNMRHGSWWLAGIFGLLTTLTRSVGLLLLLPFCYEYLRQHHFQLKSIRFDILGGILIPAGIGLFVLYGYFKVHDILAIPHAEDGYSRSLQIPGYGVWLSIQNIQQSFGFLSFTTLRNLTDLVPDLFVLALLILSFVGPWRLPRHLWAYVVYAVALYLFFQLYPHTHNGVALFPLESLSRYLLEVFPAFILLAGIGKYKTLHMSYLMVSGAILFFLLTQFLTGHWVL